MTTLLCFGDSNTHGFIPADDYASLGRYPAPQRWCGVLRQKLGAGFEVIEEGLNSRTTVWDDPFEGAHKNGKSYLPACLESHAPMDWVIVMLGTNDLKSRFSLNARDIALGAATLLDMILASGAGHQGKPPSVLLVCPPRLKGLSLFAPLFVGGEAKSEELPGHYRAQAELRGVHFLDAGCVADPSPVDGIHLDVEGHYKLGTTIAEYLLARC